MLLNKQNTKRLDPKDFHTNYSCNNKKHIKKTITHFSKEQYDASNKQIKKNISNICNLVEKGLIEVEINEIVIRGEIVTYALTTTYKDSNLCVLNLLYVEPQFRCFGLASTLVETLMLKSDIQGEAFMVELDKEEVFKIKPFYKRLGLDTTATGIFPTNIAISNQENFERLSNSGKWKISKAA
ncbi:GNAT family N-acetyltransferase [Vibrio harveyi]|uniref:GNAT family N-acetyltransferase n=1 Tax=Vibrio harveyi TaxID=669 RepID=UPI00238005C8|nr:GNAT family N-acetyltransferase [Vibrio harveyi]